MVISVRDKSGKLRVKDILDIDFDMRVRRKGATYQVAINSQFTLAEKFQSEADAEDKIREIADARNKIAVICGAAMPPTKKGGATQ